MADCSLCCHGLCRRTRHLHNSSCSCSLPVPAANNQLAVDLQLNTQVAATAARQQTISALIDLQAVRILHRPKRSHSKFERRSPIGADCCVTSQETCSAIKAATLRVWIDPRIASPIVAAVATTYKAIGSFHLGPVNLTRGHLYRHVTRCAPKAKCVVEASSCTERLSTTVKQAGGKTTLDRSWKCSFWRAHSFSFTLREGSAM